MVTEIRVPALGESVSEATIGQWFKKPGEAVSADEPLVELETDKVTIEVRAPGAGVLEAVSAKPGDTVQVGALLGQIGGARRAVGSQERRPAEDLNPQCSSGSQTPGGGAAFAGSAQDRGGAPPRAQTHRRHRKGRAPHQRRRARPGAEAGCSRSGNGGAEAGSAGRHAAGGEA